MSVPVFAVWLQAWDKVTCPWFHSDGLVIQGDDITGDFRPIAVWLLPLQEEAGRRGVTWLWWDREVQEVEGGDRVRICCRGSETHLLAVRTSTCLIHCLRGTQKHREGEGMKAFEEIQEERRGMITRGWAETRQTPRQIDRKEMEAKVKWIGKS